LCSIREICEVIHQSNPNPSPRTRFRPGLSGNPKGRPKRPPFSSQLLDVPVNGRLADLEPKETDSPIVIIAKLLVKRAIEGDYRFLKILLDRVDGRVTEWSKMDELYRLIDEDFDAANAVRLHDSVAPEGDTIEVATHLSPSAGPDPVQASNTSYLSKSYSSINNNMDSGGQSFLAANRKADLATKVLDGKLPSDVNRVRPDASVSPTGQSTISPSPTDGCRAVDAGAPNNQSQRDHPSAVRQTPLDNKTSGEPGGVIPVSRKGELTDNAIDRRDACAAPVAPVRSSPKIEPAGPSGRSGPSDLGSTASSNGPSPSGDILTGQAVGFTDALYPKSAPCFPTRLGSVTLSDSRKQNRAERRKARKVSKSLS
jgi:hypothetical protein